MSLKEVFINNLKYYRKQKGLTQNELTLLIDRSYNYINSVEQGKLIPSFEVIEKICQVLEIKPETLFSDNASPDNIKSFSKEKYIEEISESIVNKLKPFIFSEIHKSIK